MDTLKSLLPFLLATIFYNSDLIVRMQSLKIYDLQKGKIYFYEYKFKVFRYIFIPIRICYNTVSNCNNYACMTLKLDVETIEASNQIHVLIIANI
jgi:hypothetical protein